MWGLIRGRGLLEGRGLFEGGSYLKVGAYSRTYGNLSKRRQQNYTGPTQLSLMYFVTFSTFIPLQSSIMWLMQHAQYINRISFSP